MTTTSTTPIGEVITATDLRHKLSEALLQVQLHPTAPIAVTRHKKAIAALVSAEDYELLKGIRLGIYVVSAVALGEEGSPDAGAWPIAPSNTDANGSPTDFPAVAATETVFADYGTSTGIGYASEVPVYVDADAVSAAMERGATSIAAIVADPPPTLDEFVAPGASLFSNPTELKGLDKTSALEGGVGVGEAPADNSDLFPKDEEAVASDFSFE
jgi:prevent-host-death family protein